MKTLLTTFLFGAMVSASIGAAFSTGFGDAAGDFAYSLIGEVEPQDGWGLNDVVNSGTGDLTFFTQAFGTSTFSDAAVIGGVFNFPSITDVRLFNGYGDPLAGTDFSVDFQINPSFDDTPNGGPDLTGFDDDFGWSFQNGSSTLFRVAFESPAAGSGDLEFVYYDNLGTRHQIPFGGSPGSGIFYQSIYELNISFAANSGDTDFSLELIPQVGSTISFSDTLTGLNSSTTIDTFGADWSINDADPMNAGNNIMAFDNISIIPEPSALGLIGLGVLGIVFRRRR